MQSGYLGIHELAFVDAIGVSWHRRACSCRCNRGIHATLLVQSSEQFGFSSDDGQLLLGTLGFGMNGTDSHRGGPEGQDSHMLFGWWHGASTLTKVAL